MKNQHSFSFSRKQGRGSRLSGSIQEAQFVDCQFNKQYPLRKSINLNTTAVVFEESKIREDFFSTDKFNELSKVENLHLSITNLASP